MDEIAKFSIQSFNLAIVHVTFQHKNYKRQMCRVYHMHNMHALKAQPFKIDSKRL